MISLLTFIVRATTKEALVEAAVSRSAVWEKGVDSNLARIVHIAGLKQARSTLWKHETQGGQTRRYEDDSLGRQEEDTMGHEDDVGPAKSLSSVPEIDEEMLPYQGSHSHFGPCFVCLPSVLRVREFLVFIYTCQSKQEEDVC